MRPEPKFKPGTIVRHDSGKIYRIISPGYYDNWDSVVYQATDLATNERKLSVIGERFVAKEADPVSEDIVGWLVGLLNNGNETISIKKVLDKLGYQVEIKP